MCTVTTNCAQWLQIMCSVYKLSKVSKHCAYWVQALHSVYKTVHRGFKLCAAATDCAPCPHNFYTFLCTLSAKLCTFLLFGTGICL